MDEAAQQNNELTIETGRRGGLKRMAQLNDQERSALGRHAAWARWHPKEAQAAKERVEQAMYLLQQALKDKQLPLI